MSQTLRKAELHSKTQQLLHGVFKHARTAALAAALVPLGTVAVRPAVAQDCGSAGCPVVETPTDTPTETPIDTFTATPVDTVTATATVPPTDTPTGTAAPPDTSTPSPSPSATPTPAQKTIMIGPSSMEGAIRIANGDWVNGGYSMKSTVTGDLTVEARVTITGPCSNGGSDTVTVPLTTMTYHNPAAANGWLPTGDANSALSWQGSVEVGLTAPSICAGAGTLNASKGAVFTATVSASPPQPGAMVTFRFKYRDPAAKGKPNTNCLDTTDPNRAKADVCGASWSQTVTQDP